MATVVMQMFLNVVCIHTLPALFLPFSVIAYLPLLYWYVLQAHYFILWLVQFIAYLSHISCPVANFQQLRNCPHWHSESTPSVKALLNFVCRVLLFSFHMIMLAAYPIMFYTSLSSLSVVTNISFITMLKELKGWNA
jgi:hypothetical protein